MENLKLIEDRLRRIEASLICQKPVLNFEEAAAYTGLSKSYLYKLTSTGSIPHYKPQGKQIYFNRQEVEKWLLSNRRASLQEIEEQASTHVTLSKGGVQ
jgi:excisionase family DNA binding protein